ncbi:MAG: PQQ-dependent sugar dehydrogenase [Anaerolineae bacterium]|nr:PQQ-dependent sugar dehydrogenase [Anaerolineae bacterium]
MVAVPVVIAVAAVVYWRFANQERPKNHDTTQPTPYRLVIVADGLERPVTITHAGDGSGRLFVVEQSGAIKIVQDGVVLETPFLDVSDLISPEARGGGYTERGLLGLAFHPDYASNGLFYIDYTDQRGHSVVARYTGSTDDANRGDPASGTILLTVEQPYSNHNGGQVTFGPDGYLYVSLGDGGSAGDPLGSGQDSTTLLGSMLRIDVNTPDGYDIPPDNPFVNNAPARPEIWSWGLRNVWRFSFDRATGDLYMGDVGQNVWEEIDFQPASSAGGQNYGWNIYEGKHNYSEPSPVSSVIMPILEYSHQNGWCSVTGGYVYRGEQLPGLQGYYLYGDWCTGTIWAAKQDDSGVWQTAVSLESGRRISSFGEDEAGELYLVDYDGVILRFEP